LTVVLSDDVTDVRAAAAYVLGDIGAVAAPAATPALVRMLKTDETAAARVAAAEALGKLEDTRAVPFLAAVLYYAEDLYSEGASQSLMIEAAQSLAYLTGNPFTDSAPGPHGYRLNSDGMPVLVVEARDWWETEGRFQEWPVIEPQP
jgi:HEAT repeat protein